MTTFSPSRSHLTIGQDTSKPDKKGKLLKDGNLPCFFTNYRPAGRREMPNSVTPGAPAARMDNNYGEGSKPDSPRFLVGPFF